MLFFGAAVRPANALTLGNGHRLVVSLLPFAAGGQVGVEAADRNPSCHEFPATPLGDQPAYVRWNIGVSIDLSADK